MGIDRAKIEVAHAEFRRICDSGDWSGFADLFAEDGTFINSVLGEPIRGREALRSFAEDFGVPVAQTLSGKGAIPCTHPLSVGLFGRWSRIANDLIDRFSRGP